MNARSWRKADLRFVRLPASVKTRPCSVALEASGTTSTSGGQPATRLYPILTAFCAGMQRR